MQTRVTSEQSGDWSSKFRMKLVNKSLEKDGAGSIVLVPEEQEDMWHVFNLVQEGDAVRASTVCSLRLSLLTELNI